MADLAPTFVPHAKEMHVAATLDTHRARFNDFSDIVKDGDAGYGVCLGRWIVSTRSHCAKMLVNGNGTQIMVVEVNRRLNNVFPSVT